VEKRALLAIVLSVAVMAIYYTFFAPPLAPPKAPQVTEPRQEAVSSPGGEATSPQPAAGAEVAGTAAPPSGGPAAPVAPVVEAAAKEEFRLITQDQDIRLTNEGGRATWWKLTQYTINGGMAVDLIPQQARTLGLLPLQVEVKDDPELTKRLAIALHAHELTDIPEGDPSGLGPGKRVAFTYSDGQGISVRKSLELGQAGYRGRLTFEVRRNGAPIPATLIWASGLSQPPDDDTSVYGHVEGQGVLHDGREVLRFPPENLTEPRVYSASAGTPVRWAGLESTYFASLLLPAAGGAPELAVALEPHRAAQQEGSSQPLLAAGAVATGGGAYQLFVGPKDYELLRSLGHGLEQVIHFSNFSLIYLCTKWLFLALTWINSYIGNYGWSIIVLTFFLRLAFFPLMYRSSITMRQTSKKMMKVQPRVKAIQERYRKMKRSMETQRQMNEEVMALYKKEGINPMGNLGGCLPLLLQMPIFIAFYNLLAVTIEMRQAPFIFWIQDLSRRDPYYVTPLLMGASWILQQWMTSSSIPDPMQRRMMMLMPVMFTFFMMNMPSGLVIYWLTNNVLGMAQQYVTNKKADELDARAHAPQSEDGSAGSEPQAGGRSGRAGGRRRREGVEVSKG